MRIHLQSIARPKAVSKALKQILNGELQRSDKLSECQEITARLYGYRNWQEICHAAVPTVLNSSAVDEAVDEVERKHRYANQVSVLVEALSISSDLAGKIATALAPTGSGNPGTMAKSIWQETGFQTFERVLYGTRYRVWRRSESEVKKDQRFASIADVIFDEVYESNPHYMWCYGRIESGECDQIGRVGTAAEAMTNVEKFTRYEVDVERMGRRRVSKDFDAVGFGFPYADDDEDINGITLYGPGVALYDFAGKEYFRLTPRINERIPERLRHDRGYYIEYSLGALVAFVAPEYFTPGEREEANKTVRSMWPIEWSELTGNPLPEDEPALRSALLRRALADRWVAVGIDWRVKEDDRVLVRASLGGSSEFGTVIRDYMVPSALVSPERLADGDLPDDPIVIDETRDRFVDSFVLDEENFMETGLHESVPNAFRP